VNETLSHETRGNGGQAAPSPVMTLFVSAIIAGAVAVLATEPPTHIPDPVLLAVLLGASALASSLHPRTPLGVVSNLSFSSSVDLAALLLAGTEWAMLVAGLSAWLQSAFSRSRTPLFRTVFNAASLVITVKAAGLAFQYMGGQPGSLDLRLHEIAKPFVAGGVVYYVVHIAIAATAVVMSSRRSIWSVWQSSFVWTAPGYYVGAAAAAAAAILWQMQQWWAMPLAVAPVYLAFRSYRT
jgi:hypothetical protein